MQIISCSQHFRGALSAPELGGLKNSRWTSVSLKTLRCLDPNSFLIRSQQAAFISCLRVYCDLMPGWIQPDLL